MKLPMNADIYSTGFVFETVWRRIVGGATSTRATIIKWPLGGLSNLFIFISGITDRPDMILVVDCGKHLNNQQINVCVRSFFQW